MFNCPTLRWPATTLWVPKLSYVSRHGRGGSCGEKKGDWHNRRDLSCIRSKGEKGGRKGDKAILGEKRGFPTRRSSKGGGGKNIREKKFTSKRPDFPKKKGWHVGNVDEHKKNTFRPPRFGGGKKGKKFM